MANRMQQMLNRSAQLNDTLVKDLLVFDYQKKPNLHTSDAFAMSNFENVRTYELLFGFT